MVIPLNFLKHDYTTGEILYKKALFKFDDSYISDIIKRDITPISIDNIRKIFHRQYNEYMIFYFVIIRGLGRY